MTKVKNKKVMYGCIKSMRRLPLKTKVYAAKELKTCHEDMRRRRFKMAERRSYTRAVRYSGPAT